MKVIHFQIPLLKTAKKPERYAINLDNAIQFLEIIKSKLGKDYAIISSPFLPTALTEETEILNFDMRQVTLKELKLMMKEAKNEVPNL